MIICVACAGGGTALDEAELAAAEQLLPPQAGQLRDVTAAALSGREDKFPAISKVHQAENGDLVICAAAIGYNGPVQVLVAINAATSRSYGLRILRHLETAHYVRDFDSGDWFLPRFADKDVHTALYSTPLEATDAGGLVIITGSTQTTDAVILAVNAAFGLYREYALAETAAPVPQATDPEDYVEIVLPL
jgi:Na+-translocating ferredoxin:NAD+ oxidoreductase RnfG subunit